VPVRSPLGLYVKNRPGQSGLTMQKFPSHDEWKIPTQLERVLWLQGQFRRELEPIGVTPLQAGVLLYVYVRRHTETNMTKTAAALSLRLPTLTDVVNDLVRKRWVTKQRLVTDARVVQLRLSRRGLMLAQKIRAKIRDVGSEPTSTTKVGT